MFTDQELKDLHYQMWDYIVKRLREYENLSLRHYKCTPIKQLKREFLESNNIQYIIVNDCFLCEYGYIHNNPHTSHDGIPIFCDSCPSTLKSGYDLCLSGVYAAVQRNIPVYIKIGLAELIRDSWR